MKLVYYYYYFVFKLMASRLSLWMSMFVLDIRDRQNVIKSINLGSGLLITFDVTKGRYHAIVYNSGKPHVLILMVLYM